MKGELVDIVYNRMFKKFVKELFKGSQSGFGNEGHESSRKKKKQKTKNTLTKEKFLY